MDTNLQKTLDICKRVLEADETEIYDINIYYLGSNHDFVQLEENKTEFLSALKDGKSPTIEGRNFFGTNIFSCHTYDIHQIVYWYAIQEIESLCSEYPQLFLFIKSLLGVSAEEYPSVLFSHEKYLNFLENRKEKLEQITQSILSLDKSEE